MVNAIMSAKPSTETLSGRIGAFLGGEGGDFESLILEAHVFQRSHCDSYAAFCTAKPLPGTWREIPAVPLSAFRQAALRCFPEAETLRTFRTSGTTGEGYGEHHFCSLDLYKAAARNGWSTAGLPADNVHCLLPRPEEAPHSSLSQMASWLTPANQFYIHNGAANWNALAKAISATKSPVTLFGTALAFLDWFESGETCALPHGSMAVETGGYKGTRRDIPKSTLYALFTEKLGLPAADVWNEYGMTELSSQFYSRGVGTPHRSPAWMRAVVINPESGLVCDEGETGVLRIFDLANLWSVCAIQTRDLAIRRGDNFELIGRDPSALPRGCSRTADENARMTTAGIAEVLARTAMHFPILGEITVRDILETIRLELGHAEALEGFRDYGGHLSMARGPGTILHIVSGNTPHAALQSLMRGVLLRARNLVKIPSEGLPDVYRFRELLPPELAKTIEISEELSAGWVEKCDVCVVFGSDETLAHFRARIPAGKRFFGHGHRLSLGIVFEDPAFESAPQAATDVSLFNQKGCLSPHCIYVAKSPRLYAERLAVEMERFNRHTPRGAVTVGESAAILDIRANYQFRSANDPRVQIWQSATGSDWTVIFEEDPWFATSCLNRVIFVKPVPEDLSSSLLPIQHWIGGIGIWPSSPENARAVANFGASRICALGRMQYPAFSWHQDGRQTLSPLVQWVDFEP